MARHPRITTCPRMRRATVVEAEDGTQACDELRRRQLKCITARSQPPDTTLPRSCEGPPVSTTEGLCLLWLRRPRPGPRETWPLAPSRRRPGDARRPHVASRHWMGSLLPRRPSAALPLPEPRARRGRGLAPRPGVPQHRFPTDCARDEPASVPGGTSCGPARRAPRARRGARGVETALTGLGRLLG
jgi:hypothetical protein